MISDEAVEAALEVFWANEDETYLTGTKRALEAAAPHMINPEPGSAMRQAMELAWDQAVDACQDGSTLMTWSEARKLKDANPYRSQT